MLGDWDEVSGFCVDLRAGQLLENGIPVPLRPRTWAVLCHLAHRPGTLVTKDQLFDAVWGATVVSEVTLSTSIREIRKALHDDAHRPRYLETVHRRGFRFLTDLLDGEPGSDATPARTERSRGAARAAVWLVGRQVELAHLVAELERAATRDARLVFISGEAGIGKSALLHSFLDAAAGTRAACPVRTTVGRSVAQRDGGESYLALLDAVERLVDDIGDAVVLPLLRETAPAWLAQLPWLAGSDRPGTPEAAPPGSPRRMPRELARFLEALSERATIVLALEDLHLGDRATIDLLRVLAGRRRPARLLVVTTHRTAEAIIDDTGIPELVRDLRAGGASTEIDLGLLAEADVRDYLHARFGGARVPPDLPARVHAYTDGHPLFLTSVADDLEARCLIGGEGTGKSGAEPIALRKPAGLREFLRARLRPVAGEARHVLEAASVAGDAFDGETVAAATDLDVDTVEAACGSLARQNLFLRERGLSDWPDGSVSAHYEFVHALYRSALYDDLGDARRRLLHQRIGERLEAGFARSQDERAAEIASHFAASHDHRRAASHLLASARTARRRFAEQAAVERLRAALAALARVAPGEERQQLELAIRTMLAPALIATEGYASPRVEAEFARAQALASELGLPLAELAARAGIGQSVLSRGDVAGAVRYFRQLCDDVADGGLPPMFRAGLRAQLALTLVYGGDLLAAERELGTVLADVDPLSAPDADAAMLAPDSVDPVVLILGLDAVVLAYRGHLDAARGRVARCRMRAERSGHPFTKAFAATYEGQVHFIARDADGLAEVAGAIAALAERYDVFDWKAYAVLLEGVGLAERGDLSAAVPRLREAVTALDAAGIVAGTSYFFTLVAEGLLAAGDVGAAERLLDRAAARLRQGEHIAEADIALLRVDCALASGSGLRTEDAARRLRVAREGALERGNVCSARRIDARLGAAA